jgi:quercetin dioxygenase-like cupin family protein
MRLLLLLLFLLGTSEALAQSSRPRVSPGDTVRPQIERLAGSQQKQGLFAERQRFSRNFRALPHWHDREVHITVLRGALYASRGDRFDLSKVRPLGPESFLIIPAGVHHFEWVPAGTVLQVEGVGPVKTTYGGRR